MQARIGTSGYQYKFWRGTLYPEKCKEAEMLGIFSRAFDTVEINNTFYRMPKREVLERWAAQVPETFRFAIKAPQRLTHVQRLKADDDSLEYFVKNLEALGDKLGVVLFQLPPFFKQDLERLQAFLARLPKHMRVSFEFRHASWQDDAVHAVLREHGAALCTADVENGDTQIVCTAGFGYVRLRRETYADAELTAWAELVSKQPWSDVFVYFKHEEDAPVLASRFRDGFDRPGLARGRVASAG